MFGQNPIRPIVKSDGSTLFVKNMFLTLQGEGPYTGRPAVFLRLGGCNLQCSFCDTEFEDFQEVETKDVLEKVQVLFPASVNNKALVVITGGEPLRQEIGPLCQYLLDNNYDVQIETNGILYRTLPSKVSVVCSPKPMERTGYSRLRADLAPHIIALKFLVSTHLKHYQDIPDIGQGQYNIPTYIQPIDEGDAVQNKLNMDLAIKLSHKYNARFSLQMHKIIGIE